MSQAPRDLTPGRSARDLFGSELRHWRCSRELSQTQLAGLTHFSGDLISKVEKAERWPGRDLAEACDTALDTGGALARIWPWVETEHRYALAHLPGRLPGHPPGQSPVHADHADIEPAGAGFGMRMADKAGSAGFAGGVLSHTGRSTRAGARPRGRGGARRPAAPAAQGGGPLSLEAYLAMTAHESAWFSDHPTNVGPATLDQLRSDATRLARMFANAPRLEVFTHARWLRDRAFDLLDGRQRVSESKDLYFLAGATCGMLADVSADFGYYNEAMAHTRAAWLCAEQAGHNGLKAWILSEQSEIAYFDGRPSHAASYARRGQDFETTGTVSARLPAIEARATGKLGNAEATRAALVRAATAREHVTPDELDELGGVMAFGDPKQHFYGAESYLSIGDHPTVVTEAESCLAGYRDGPDSERAYDNMASTRVNQAQALVADDLEAARDAAQPAFGLDPELRGAPLRQRLRQLHTRLTDPAVAAAPVAIDLRDHIEHFLGTTPSLPFTP
ncbi:MAG TPA: helix-turn-helix transcriptional regulator [Mycobacteriales bacterium]|nr:helix-turn-helix transcriptional regulator [Mycobacteriales bacterium]